MAIPYDIFGTAFLAKVSDYDIGNIDEYVATEIVDDYMKRAISEFNTCAYNLSIGDDELRSFDVEVPEDELMEIVDIISDGMVLQWMKPHMYNQENFRNLLNTKDFQGYSPAELTYRITNAYQDCRRHYIVRVREYSYNHGDLTDLYL